MKNISDFTTYNTGILQARAYRNLRHFMAQTLRKHDLTSTEWSLIGVVSDKTADGGIRVSDLATLLDVEKSFITNSVKKLMKKGYFEYGYLEDDGRVRLVLGTALCHAKVAEVERLMRMEMKVWLGEVRPGELVRYINVLQKIAQLTV